MDIWEANSMANALTPHTCSRVGSFLCAGEECGKTEVGVCDKNGCGINPFATGSKDFYGPGMTVDTSKPFTVVTQFLTADNSSTGELSEIRRLYIQNGNVIENAPVSTNEAAVAGAVTQDFCSASNASSFLRLGGMSGMGASLARGMVLIFSIWNSEGDFMNWLDSGNAGPCSNTSGDPALIVANNPEVSVTFSNIRWGDIGSTFNTSTAGTTSQVVNTNLKAANGALSRYTVGGSIWLGIAAAMIYVL